MTGPVPGPSVVQAEDGTPLALEVSGTGDPVLLVHGAAADARQWDRVTPLLGGRFRVVAMDRRGRRASGPLPPGATYAVECDDVVTVAASLGPAVHLVGHSSGARYALHAAPRIPHLASLTLYEPPEPERPSEDHLTRLDRLAEAGDRQGVLRAFFVDLLGAGEADFAALRRRPVWPYMVDNALNVPGELRAGRDYRFDPAEFARFERPVLLLVGGESDDDTRRVNDQLAAVLPRARLQELDGQGHGAMISAPTLFATTVLDFLTQVAEL